MHRRPIRPAPVIRLALLFLLWLGFGASSAMANMASPWNDGSKGAFPLVSRQIDVLGESLRIRAFGELDSASVQATYRISVPPGVHGALPLLFVALDLHDAVRVLYDGRPVALSALPIMDLGGYLSTNVDGEQDPTVAVYFDEHTGHVYNLRDLQAFSVDLTPGEHTVEVQYSASPWTFRGSWIQERSIRYALSPARHWKSFGPLEVVIEVPAGEGMVRCTLKDPTEGSLPGRAVWRFAELPADHLAITFTPKVGPTARLLMGLSPFGIALGAGALLLLLHIRWMHRFRVNGHTGRSWPLVVGALLAPLGFLLAYAFAYPLIDAAIGPVASGRHGYEMLAVPFFYPVIMPLYALGCWLLDRFWKKRHAEEVAEVTG